jgi:hypothetical protein
MDSFVFWNRKIVTKPMECPLFLKAFWDALIKTSINEYKRHGEHPITGDKERIQAAELEIFGSLLLERVI